MDGGRGRDGGGSGSSICCRGKTEYLNINDVTPPVLSPDSECPCQWL